ncbi:Hypothetical protein CINCED_3A017895 [Cinara cedri]|uniref:Uncharacterized protein n=1 Tax=Cinara cedri TaxID=506608 RepID=A0A5E4MG80_9HEMI|nr:Hypothetical protein CINCED_3A017895 [Cinara cedri]
MATYVRDQKLWTLNDRSTKISTIAINQIVILKKEKIFDTSNLLGNIKYWKIHCGHGVDELGRIKLDKESRIQIAEKNPHYTIKKECKIVALELIQSIKQIISGSKNSKDNSKLHKQVGCPK